MDTPNPPLRQDRTVCRSDQPVAETPSPRGASQPHLAVTGASIPAMSVRRPYRSRPGRYKGERKLVGARVWTEIVEQVDDQLEEVGCTQNDWLQAAVVVALENPDSLKLTLARLAEEEAERTRARIESASRQRAAKQLSLAEEVLDRSA